MGNPYPWKYGNTSENTAAELDPRYETPLGAQERADKAEEESKSYTDALDDRFKAHTADQTVHVTQTDHNKLDGLEWGAEVNQNAYTVINGIPANAPMTEFTIIQGIGIRVTKDPDGRSITITATGPVDIDPIPLSKVYDAGNSAYLDAGTAAGNVPVLDVNGKLDTTVVPAIAVTDTFVVATQADMLALTVEKGDVAIRTDLSKSFILKDGDPTVLASWQELLTPMSPVQSVAGKTGVVTLTKADVGLSNVTNESKVTMFTNPALTGTPTAPTATAATNTTQIATTAYVKSQGYLAADYPVNINRQALINGNFDIWQRGTSFTTSGYTADRWRCSTSTAATISRQTFAPGQTEVPNNPKYFLRFNQTVAPTDQSWIGQLIESVSTLANGKCTLSFYAKAATSLSCDVFLRQSFGTGGSANVETSKQTINLTTTWQKFILTFDLLSIFGKTLGTLGTDSLAVYIFPLLGVTFTMDIAQVQLCAGDVSYPYQPRSFVDEFASCLRYYEKNYAYGLPAGSVNQQNIPVLTAGSTSALFGNVRYSTPKRKIPTVNIYSYSGTINKVSVTGNSADVGTAVTIDAANANENGFSKLVDSGAGFTSGQSYWFNWAADAEM
ncbi:hypothetical protein [Paenibacillus polymyxa]|uniref:hypothetical protein n=1 Tax=Paenibacillus polymyxa TaxID=1406 RepID=UPI002379D3C1|nr:hypothetical protein [Paenibacillus polymyxa]WDM22650.1 hypothetical protein J4I02_03245 [Paenibacillus polymyxa]